MELLVMIVVNIFVCTVFYLVISLKLEKKASEFREKRIMKIMDDIIRDFNLTAERNISILENRIAVMKKMLEHAGALPGIDLSVADDDAAAPVERTVDVRSSRDGEERPNGGVRVASPAVSGHTSDGAGLGGILGALVRAIGAVAARVIGGRDARADGPEERTGMRSSVSVESRVSPTAREAVARRSIDITIEKDMAELAALAADGEKAERSRPKSDLLPDEELATMFDTSDDKYALISDLYGKGYDLEVLSRCSGVPLGEIKLVVSLNRPTAGPTL